MKKKSHFSFLLVRLKKFLVQSSLTVWKVLWDISNVKKIQNSPSTILGQSNASNQSPWQQIRSFDQFFFTEFTFLITENSEMEMKTIKCLSLLLRVFVSKVNADYILAMPLIVLFLLWSMRGNVKEVTQFCHFIILFIQPLIVCLYINSILLASFV